jgi:hypothetical protein
LAAIDSIEGIPEEKLRVKLWTDAAVKIFYLNRFSVITCALSSFSQCMNWTLWLSLA